MTKFGVTPSDELDVRHVPKPQRHALIFSQFAALPPSGSFVLVNSHDPKHLRQEFERDHPGTYTWRYLETGPTWRIQITKRTVAEAPRVLGNAHALLNGGRPSDAAGAIWRLEISQRHLDANVIHLEADGQIGTHTGPDLDVLMYVISGEGWLATETDSAVLEPGCLAWLPRRSRRSITAGPSGLSYLTVHPRRPALSIDTAAASVTSA
jgi:uncharacterized protein (DUF2249 family)/quercetin dioxygenase-like cupin family protein